VEGVFVLVILVVDALADLVGGRAGSDERGLQPRRPGLQRQHHFRDVAGDDDVHLVLVDRALEGANRVRRRTVVVIGDDFYSASIDAALGVDFVGGELCRLWDRCARDGLGFGDDADLDGIGGEGNAGPHAERGRGQQGAQRPLVGVSYCHDLISFSLDWLCGRAFEQPRFNCNLVGEHGKRNRLRQMVGAGLRLKWGLGCTAALIGGRVWSTCS
jgi:hypothetical protein